MRIQSKYLVLPIACLLGAIGCDDDSSEQVDSGAVVVDSGIDAGRDSGTDEDVDAGELDDADVDGGDADIDGGDADIDGGDADVDGGDVDVGVDSGMTT